MSEESNNPGLHIFTWKYSSVISYNFFLENVEDKSPFNKDLVPNLT